MLAPLLAALALAAPCTSQDVDVTLGFEGVAGGRVIAATARSRTGPCLLRSATVRILRTNRLAEVRGNPSQATFARVITKRKTTRLAWIWRNWCGRTAAFQVFAAVGGPGGYGTAVRTLRGGPLCAAPGELSTLGRL